jgi:plasmid stabilization system protein ParE
MTYQVSITEQAEADLRGIYEYIAFEKLSPENAVGQIDRLEKHIMELESFPKRYISLKKGYSHIYLSISQDMRKSLPRRETLKMP